MSQFQTIPPSCLFQVTLKDRMKIKIPRQTMEFITYGKSCEDRLRIFQLNEETR